VLYVPWIASLRSRRRLRCRLTQNALSGIGGGKRGRSSLSFFTVSITRLRTAVRISALLMLKKARWSRKPSSTMSR